MYALSQRAPAPLLLWKEAETIRLDPPNKLWYVNEFLNTVVNKPQVIGGWMGSMILLGLLAYYVLVPSMFGESLSDLDTAARIFFAAVVGVVVPICVAGVILIIPVLGARGPRVNWRTYSLQEFQNTYDFVMPQIFRDKIRDIRAVFPEAEFTLAVLEKEKSDDFEQLLLLKVLDDLQSHSKYSRNDGEPVLALDSSFKEIPLPKLA